MKWINRWTVGVYAVIACALLVAGLTGVPVQAASEVSADEARLVSGGTTGPCWVGATGGFGCTVGGFNGIKFWEGCTYTPWYGMNYTVRGNDDSASGTCYTSCGYVCGYYRYRVSCSTFTTTTETTTVGE